MIIIDSFNFFFQNISINFDENFDKMFCRVDFLDLYTFLGKKTGIKNCNKLSGLKGLYPIRYVFF